MDKIEILKEQSKKLIEMLSEVIDYSMGMKMATGYTTCSEPNMLAMCRFIDKAKSEVE